MKKTLSILTPVLAQPDNFELIHEASWSIHSQEIPPGWQIEWIVVEDGETPLLADFPWPRNTRYRAARRRVGEPAARTIALSLASGEYVLAFDADDTLPPGAIKRICL